MVLATRSVGILGALAVLGLAGSAQAGDSSPVLSSQEKTEFSRYVSEPKGVPAAPDTCEASDRRRQVVGTLKSVEAQLALARADQEALRKKKGWTDKQAAAAGQAVMLNGSGYNYRSKSR